MKASEVRELSTSDIVERIDTEKNMLLRMRLSHAITPLDNPRKLKATKVTIARLLTELRKRELNTESNIS